MVGNQTPGAANHKQEGYDKHVGKRGLYSTLGIPGPGQPALERGVPIIYN